MLQARGLLDASDPTAWEILAPDIAITAWAADAERRTREWRARAPASCTNCSWPSAITKSSTPEIAKFRLARRHRVGDRDDHGCRPE